MNDVPCPSCGHDDSLSIDSRWSKTANGRRRRRVCNKCGSRFTTIETLHTHHRKNHDPLTRFPAFAQSVSAAPCPRCDGEGLERHRRRLARVMEEFRIECGCTRVDVAHRMGYGYEYLEKLEKGHRRWRPELIRKFVTACVRQKTNTSIR